MKELDAIALTHDIKEHALKEGDVGAIVHVHGKKDFEVEFVTAQGETIAVLTLTEADIRPIEGRKILNVRDMGETAIHA